MWLLKGFKTNLSTFFSYNLWFSTFSLFFLYYNFTNNLIGNTILVRELWFGGLPDNIQEKKLKNTVEMFGDVENIEFFTRVTNLLEFFSNFISAKWMLCFCKIQKG